jgi:hypothetical protein
MAEWKKLVVSGSNISQLNNDAGYLTAGTITQANGYATASANGVELLAANVTASLNFASSSGQGLTIAATSGPNTLTFGLSAVPNNSLANSAITIAGTSTSLGGSITAAQILAGTGVFSGSAQLPAGTVSGSSQVSYTGLSDVPSGIVSGSSQVVSLLPAGTVSGSAQISFSGITGVPAGIVSASVLSSPGQGQALLTTNGVAGSTIDLGLETGDSPSFAGVTAGNITVGVTNDNTINTTSGDLTITPNVIITGDLTVNGTTTTINTDNLLVEDKFILLASGSTSATDGGIIIQSNANGSGFAFLYDAGQARWGYTGSLAYNATTATPDAFAAMVLDLQNGSSDIAAYQKNGNIKIDSGNIYIYA